MSPGPASIGELVIYATEDGQAHIFLRAEGGTVWLSQAEIAVLFQTTPQNITQHIRAIYAQGEARETATCKPYLQVQKEGRRQVRRTIKFYSLDVILAVGYRVKSPRGTQFRQWATAHLREYLVKGFVLDDERLKDPRGWDYFDELLQRIREIRASEMRFCQKVRELFALSVDHGDDAGAAEQFLADVQSKMLYAVTQRTAAEIVVERADATRPHMALTVWKGPHVREADVVVAKNYLNAAETEQLNHMVMAFLEFAELRTRQRKALCMADWRQYVDNFIRFNDGPLLQGAGRVSHADMVAIAHQRYEEFDAQRRQALVRAADAQDLADLEQAQRLLGKNGAKPDAA